MPANKQAVLSLYLESNWTRFRSVVEQKNVSPLVRLPEFVDKAQL